MKSQKLALVPAKGLGDALIWMALYFNLRIYSDLVLFSNVLCGMESCFDNVEIRPLNDDAISSLSSFDQVIASDHAHVPLPLGASIVHEKDFDKSLCFLDNLMVFAKKSLNLRIETKELFFNFDTANHRKEKNRVLIHPLSTSLHKNWTKARFLRLAERLQRAAYHPVFCMDVNERAAFGDCAFDIVSFERLGDFATYCHESGYFIGNDSGPGHLCSALGIPVLSIFSRLSYARLWRPGWGRSIVVSPFVPLFGASLKIKYWQYFLTSAKVFKAFQKLEKLDRRV